MAEVTVKDGGSGNIASVDINKRLHVQALTLDVLLDAHLSDNAYDVSTGGLINMTGTGKNALIYVENTGNADLIVDRIIVDSTASQVAGAAGNLHWHLNIVGGTIVDEAVDAQILNRRIGSPVNLAVKAYKGAAEGKLFSGGDLIDFPFVPGTGVVFDVPFIIPKGQTFGVMYEPPTGNTNMDMQVGLVIIVDSSTD